MIAVFITEMVILFKHVIFIIIIIYNRYPGRFRSNRQDCQRTTQSTAGHWSVQILGDDALRPPLLALDPELVFLARPLRTQNRSVPLHRPS